MVLFFVTSTAVGWFCCSSRMDGAGKMVRQKPVWFFNDGLQSLTVTTCKKGFGKKMKES